MNCAIIGGCNFDKVLFQGFCLKLIGEGFDKFLIKRNPENYEIPLLINDFRVSYKVKLACVDNKFIYETHEKLFDEIFNMLSRTDVEDPFLYLVMNSQKVIILKDDDLIKNIEMCVGLNKDFYVL